MGRSTKRRQHGQKKTTTKAARAPGWWPKSHRPKVEGIDSIELDRAAAAYVWWLESVRGSGMMRGRPSQSARRGKLENLLRRVFVAGKMSEREPSLSDPHDASLWVMQDGVYVNTTTGDDTNPGTRERPFRTWAAARAAIERGAAPVRTISNMPEAER